MTPIELRAIRAALKLSQAGMSRRLDMSLRHYKAYELGEYPIPEVVSLAADRLLDLSRG